LEDFELLPLLLVSRGRFHSADGALLEGEASDVVKKAADGKALYIIDADGISSNKPNIGLLKAASRKAELWVDAGPRYADDAMDLFIGGADRVTARWSKLRSEDELAELAELSEDVYLGVEYDAGFRQNPGMNASSERAVREIATKFGVGVVVVDVKSGSGLGGLSKGFLSGWEGFNGRKYALGGEIDEHVVGDLRSLGFAGAIGARRR
jgi:uncharacterized protein related to proFAR isomerase